MYGSVSIAVILHIAVYIECKVLYIAIQVLPILVFLVGRYQDHIYWYPGLETYRYQYIIITMSLFNVIGFNKKIPFTDIGKKICICHKPICVLVTQMMC